MGRRDRRPEKDPLTQERCPVCAKPFLFTLPGVRRNPTVMCTGCSKEGGGIFNLKRIRSDHGKADKRAGKRVS